MFVITRLINDRFHVFDDWDFEICYMDYEHNKKWLFYACEVIWKWFSDNQNSFLNSSWNGFYLKKKKGNRVTTFCTLFNCFRHQNSKRWMSISHHFNDNLVISSDHCFTLSKINSFLFSTIFFSSFFNFFFSFFVVGINYWWNLFKSMQKYLSSTNVISSLTKDFIVQWMHWDQRPLPDGWREFIFTKKLLILLSFCIWKIKSMCYVL